MALTPHPLVTGVAKGFNEKDVASFGAALQEVLPRPKKGEEAGAKPPGDKDLLGALATAGELPDLVAFAGFVGPELPYEWSGVKKWRLLYLDWRLVTWLLVPEDRIYYSARIEDKTVPDEGRDVIWVDGNARIKRGGGPQTLQARFLSGDFVRALDLRESLTGGTFTAATGVFCEAVTATCCGKPTRH